LNALAAIAVGLELGVPFDRIVAGLGEFRGAERRFEIKGEPRGVLVVDDYGHHPTEIAAVMAAAGSLNRRIVVAFQPHRHTRTAALMAEFGPAFRGAAHVVVSDIYAAGEEPIPGVTIEALAAHIRSEVPRVELAPAIGDVAGAVHRLVRPGDVVITLGAGSIGGTSDALVRLLTESRPSQWGGGS
jgi:UDP-N-acetylmuramate--alanine ligase